MDPRTSVVSGVTEPETDEIVVMKFGGSSVGSAERIQRVVEIIESKRRIASPVVIVSAVGGVTDQLERALEQLATDAFDPAPLVSSLRSLHRGIAAGVLSSEHAEAYDVTLREELEGLDRVLRDARSSAATPALRDSVLSMGERLSAPLVSRALSSAGCPSAAFSAAPLIATYRTNGEVSVHMSETFAAIRRWYALRDREIVPVITGFIGGTAEGETTTLGRGGSDYSAAIVACALKANILERWTDVDGLYNKDPHTNSDARHLRQLTFEEALEATHQGTFGMHPRTLDPLKDAQTEVHVRGTMTPDAPGTVIASG